MSLQSSNSELVEILEYFNYTVSAGELLCSGQKLKLQKYRDNLQCLWLVLPHPKCFLGGICIFPSVGKTEYTCSP